MKISARNVLKGKIIDVVEGATTAHVRIKVGAAVITASITNEAVKRAWSQEGHGGVGRHKGIGCHGGH